MAKTWSFSLILAAVVLFLCGCGEDMPTPSAGRDDGRDTRPDTGRLLELRYAEQFTVDYDTAGRAAVTINGTDRFLIIPEGVPDAEETGGKNAASLTESGGSGDHTGRGEGNRTGRGEGDHIIKPIERTADGAAVLRLPLPGLYVASSSVLDFFRALDALDAVRFTSSKAADWSLLEVREAMDDGRLLYAGKYSAPNFEALLWENCGLAIENTMILHSPDIREQLEALGIPVLVERSSYERHPLGRMEWIKLYGLLTGREAEAAAFFDQQAAAVERIAGETGGGNTEGVTGGAAGRPAGETGTTGETDTTGGTGKTPVTAAFFSINPNGSVSVRKSGDYMIRLMELAGGQSVYADALPKEESARYALNMQMEAFYAASRDADVLIYNGTVDGGVNTIPQLLGKSPLLDSFRAVQSGNVWCTERNLFQEPTAAAGMIEDLHAIFTGTADEGLTYLRRVTS